MPTVLDSLNSALHRALAANDRVYLLGEDVLDPYGGAFKVTRGLSTAFPGRVLACPVSEAAIVGVAAGMALRGLRPVVEIMFGDFVTLIADQVINHAAKFRSMYGERVQVPLLIRTPMGGRRGYGPTHSQTLEKLYLGVPGLRVIAPAALEDPGRLLEQAILENEDPLLFIENKLLYPLPVLLPAGLTDFDCMLAPDGASPAYTLTIRGAPSPTLTLAAYGHTAELARQASVSLAYESEIITELVIPTQLAPFEMGPILASVARTGRLLALEEGTLTMGWGAEVVARAAEALGPRLKAARRLASCDLAIPASPPLEAAVIPGVNDILHTARDLLGKP